jgi:hypothetical protein
MGFARTLLLGHVGNRLDIDDCEREISSLRTKLLVPCFVSAAAVLTLLLCGCGKSQSLPRVYTAATKGAASADDLADQFKKAYTAHDADAAMQMFYWNSPDDQNYWWVSLNDMFATPFDAFEVVSPRAETESEHPEAKTAFPVVARLRITTKLTSTSTSEDILLIGENEDGFYFVPPINK